MRLRPTDGPISFTDAGPVLLAGVLVLTGCGASGTAGAEQRPGEAARRDASGQSCMAAYAERPCELLTEDLVRTHVTAPPEIEQTDVAQRLAKLGVKPRSSTHIAQNGCSFAWNGGRTRARRQPRQTDGGSPLASALGRLTEPLPIDDTVAIKSIRVLETDDPLARFERTWRAPTAEERARLAAKMDEAMEEAREKGELTDIGTRAGKSVGRSMANASIAYEPVDGVGTAARWGGMNRERSLMVLDGDTEFAVVVDVSDDEAANRALAIAIARDLLDRCDD